MGWSKGTALLKSLMLGGGSPRGAVIAQHNIAQHYNSETPMKLIPALALLALMASAPAMAQDITYLKKAEVEELATGKIWKLTRLSNSSKLRWDIRKGGTLYANNLTAGGSDTAAWSVNDAGALCVKWRGTSRDGCMLVQNDGSKFKGYPENDSKTAFMEFTVE